MNGFADDAYAPMRAVFEKSPEAGASVSVTVDGRTVVDLWKGFADEAAGRRWERDTIVNVYSCTKTMAATTALLVADRGELDLDAPVRRYWPEFAAAGKDEVTVAQILSHSSGLSGWVEPITVEDLYDWDKATSLLAAQEPLWKPGTAGGYHVVTHGFLIGEVIRRITGRTIGTVFREEIAEPLGADFHIGLPESQEPRVALPVQAEADTTLPAEPTHIQRISGTNPMLGIDVYRSRAWRAAEIPAAGGTANARAMATILAVLACGGETADGLRLLSESGVRRALDVQVEGPDLVLGMPVRWGLGFAVSGAGMPGPNMIYWGGLGGSLVLADLDTRTTFAYAPSRMADTLADSRGLELLMAMWAAQAASRS